MVKVFLTFLLLSYSSGIFGKDYFEYHSKINKAEKYIFVENKMDSGLNLYKQVFRDFDFVYVGDCVTAIQIALYNNDENAFLNFTQKAFQNGLMLRNFKKIYYIKTNPLYLKDTAQFSKIYKQNRRHYLKRIDTAVLKQMYYLYVDDQLNKNEFKNGLESPEAYEDRYFPILSNILSKLSEITKSKGIPLDRIIGIDQRDIMKELRINFPDIEEFYWRNKKSCQSTIEVGQFQADEPYLYSHFYFPIMIHSQNMLRKWDDSAILLTQIKLGNIHPKDVGFFNDNYYGYNHGEQTLKANSCFYAVGVRPNKTGPNALFVPDAQINKCRERIYLPPIEQDKAKWKFMEANKMNYGWGYVGTRS